MQALSYVIKFYLGDSERKDERVLLDGKTFFSTETFPPGNRNRCTVRLCGQNSHFRLGSMARDGHECESEANFALIGPG